MQKSNVARMSNEVFVEARELSQGRKTGLAAPSLRRYRGPLTIIDRCFLLVAAVVGLCALVGLVELLSGWTLPAPSAWQVPRQVGH